MATFRLLSEGSEYENQFTPSSFFNCVRYSWTTLYSSGSVGIKRSPYPKGRAFGLRPSFSDNWWKWCAQLGNHSTTSGGYHRRGSDDLVFPSCGCTGAKDGPGIASSAMDALAVHSARERWASEARILVSAVADPLPSRT